MELFDKVKSIIVKQFKLEEDVVKTDTSFGDDLGIESLDFVELIIALEEEFDMAIPDEDAQKIGTVGDAVKYIQDRQ